jgi:hypothetical protein
MQFKMQLVGFGKLLGFGKKVKDDKNNNKCAFITHEIESLYDIYRPKFLFRLGSTSSEMFQLRPNS